MYGCIWPLCDRCSVLVAECVKNQEPKVVNIKLKEADNMPRFNEYAEYVNNHILSVKQMWLKMKSSEGFPYASDILFMGLMESFIENHDNSKFSDEEFGPYATKFYPNPEDVISDEEFATAVNHHYRMNPHHWQFWVTPDGIKAPPHPYIRHLYLCEMVCDWMAMGKAFGNSATEYYLKNIRTIILDEPSRTFTELLLRVVEPDQWINKEVES